jgi:hypothetical protein
VKGIHSAARGFWFPFPIRYAARRG